MKATSARGLARSEGRAERFMRSAAVTEGKRQRRSGTNQIFARPWRMLLAARAKAKFWTPYKNAPGRSGVRGREFLSWRDYCLIGSEAEASCKTGSVDW